MSKNSNKLSKALSLLIAVKQTYKSSTINNYTTDKLHKITGLHANTIKKRIKTLKEIGLVKFIGKHKEHLLFESVTSSSEHRNVYADFSTFKNVKDIEKALLALLIVEIQKKKDFAKHTIQSAQNPSNLEECKRAKKICNRYGYGKEYKEYGLSYKTIAKKLRVCLQKAFEIVKFAIENDFLVKTKREIQKFFYGIGNSSKYIEDGKFTFYTSNNAYKVLANVYSVGSACYPLGKY